jgi:RHS repeat-associated protein
MIQKTVDGTVTLFFYNIEDRLVRVEDGSGSVIATYGYDPFGRRLWKEVSGVRTWYMYADEGLTAEFDGSGTELKAYGWKPASTWGTDPLFMKVGTEYYFYHNDHLGTPQKMTVTNGAVVWSAKYSSFGEAFVDLTSSVENNLRFPGQYYDDETGLHYNYHRYYDPTTGRYLIPDPIGLKGGINLFAYVLNNPINAFDPLGLEECSYCPGGKWDVDIHGNFNLAIIIGGSRSRVTFTCLSNNKKCTGVLNCATFGAGFDIGIGYSFESHGEEGRKTLGTGTVIYEYFSEGSIEHYHSSQTVVSAGFFSTSGNNVNVSVGASLFVGKQFCTAASIVCDD